MSAVNDFGDMSLEMEVDAFRRLFPWRFHERHLSESLRPDARSLGKARETTLFLGAVASADGSALTKIGFTTMMAAIKMEVMTPTTESPDEGCIAIDFHMPPICSPIVRPGRPAEVAPFVSKQLSDTIFSSGMINLKDLCFVSGKAAWMAYLDIYCLDADGALFDTALLSTVAAFSHLKIPVVSLNDDGRVVVSEAIEGQNLENEPVNKDKRKLKLSTIPFFLTCILHKHFILADPTVEEESIMDTLLTIVLDSSCQLVSLFKPGGTFVAYNSVVQLSKKMARIYRTTCKRVPVPTQRVRFQMPAQFPDSSTDESEARARMDAPPLPSSSSDSILEPESDPSEASSRHVRESEAPNPGPLVIVPAPVLQPIPLRALLAHVSSPTSAMSPAPAGGPDPVPYHVYAELAREYEFLHRKNRELVRLFLSSGGSVGP